MALVTIGVNDRVIAAHMTVEARRRGVRTYDGKRRRRVIEGRWTPGCRRMACGAILRELI